MLFGMVTSVPASASSGASAAAGQVLSKARLVGHSTPSASVSHLPQSTLAAGDTVAAYTDDPRVVRMLAGQAGQPAILHVGGTSVLLPSNPHQSGDAKEGAAGSIKGLNAFDMFNSHGFVVEPPDQGLCANSRNIIEMVNLNFNVYDQNLNLLNPKPFVLETFFNEPLAFGAAGGDVTVQGDPRCVWDPTTGRWFLSQLVVDFSNSTSLFEVAVSTSSNPLGDYNVYMFNNTDDGTNGTPKNPNCPCLGDQPTLGLNQDALFVDTNEFGLAQGFNGAVIYTLDKRALARGENEANVVADFVGLNVATPEWSTNSTNCTNSLGLYCWATIRPAVSPTGGDRRFGGVEYLLSALEFFGIPGAHDNRIAVWAVTNTRSISSEDPELNLSHQVLNSQPYVFPAVQTSDPFVPLFARQKAADAAHPIPLGQRGWYSCVNPASLTTPPTAGPYPCPIALSTPQPEGMIQTNDDQMGSAVFANGLVWGGQTTLMQSGQIGIGYYAVRPNLKASGLSGSSIALQGYLTDPGNDVEYPSIAVTPDGHGLISFTLSGPDFYPTSAYALIDRNGVGRVKIAALGQSPSDGFTEYEFLPVGAPHINHSLYRPRWGDYSAAVAVGNTFVFASEYIQVANCPLTQWNSDHTCNGTRARGANWGTAVNKVTVGEEGKD
jgi:hypothetical protein